MPSHLRHPQRHRPDTPHDADTPRDADNSGNSPARSPSGPAVGIPDRACDGDLVVKANARIAEE
jgi:hypothetical protein